jgi:hypothetical protein
MIESDGLALNRCQALQQARRIRRIRLEQNRESGPWDRAQWVLLIQSPRTKRRLDVRRIAALRSQSSSTGEWSAIRETLLWFYSETGIRTGGFLLQV